MKRPLALLIPMAMLLFAAGPQPILSAAPGAWQIAVPGQAVRSVCVAGDEGLVQIGHPGAMCRPRLIGRDRNAVTYRYDCPGSGWGQTTLRFVSPGTARIEAQGIANGLPFYHVAEAERVGECTTGAR